MRNLFLILGFFLVVGASSSTAQSTETKWLYFYPSYGSTGITFYKIEAYKDSSGFYTGVTVSAYDYMANTLHPAPDFYYTCYTGPNGTGTLLTIGASNGVMGTGPVSSSSWNNSGVTSFHFELEDFNLGQQIQSVMFY
ncbi:hypothetical protein FUAX_33330 [Fulvitalea axinellae]|uniref:Uncharacterized protein n=1 Tax=Fulvitalea axinellae TaxID=1182444 RepID=A0AAU9DCL6_9BACT|nr:hypothetical protein FUAX_33330 [Fulvitalea axinellae]